MAVDWCVAKNRFQQSDPGVSTLSVQCVYTTVNFVLILHYSFGTCITNSQYSSCSWPLTEVTKSTATSSQKPSQNRAKRKKDEDEDDTTSDSEEEEDSDEDEDTESEDDDEEEEVKKQPPKKPRKSDAEEGRTLFVRCEELLCVGISAGIFNLHPSHYSSFAEI